MVFYRRFGARYLFFFPRAWTFWEEFLCCRRITDLSRLAAFGPQSNEAAQMSAIGTKRTWACALQMSAFGGKADMAFCTAHMSAYDPKRTYSTSIDAPAMLRCQGRRPAHLDRKGRMQARLLQGCARSRAHGCGRPGRRSSACHARSR